MTFAEIKEAVQTNLSALKSIMDALDLKVKEAEEIIELARTELARHKSIFYSTWQLTINREGKVHHIELYWGSCIDELMITINGKRELTPHNTLLLADMMTNITAFIVKELASTVHAFPAPNDTITTHPLAEKSKTEEPKKTLSGWQAPWKK